MNNIDCIKIGNLEGFGRNYLEKAILFTLEKNFSKAYQYIIEALEYLTCDCKSGKWYEKFKGSDPEIFNDIENAESNHFEYFFVKAFVLSYSEDLINLYAAMEAINKYIRTNTEDPNGHYVRGNILNAIEKYDEAFESYFEAAKISNNKRLNYRIGRMKELKREEFGINFLYSSFLENPSSICCAKTLHIAFNKRNLDLEYDTNSSPNKLMLLFETNNSLAFISSYKKRFDSQLEDWEAKAEIHEFLKILKNNENLFVEDAIEDNEDYESDYDYSDDYESYSNPMDSEYYNDSLDMDQQSPEFWDDI